MNLFLDKIGKQYEGEWIFKSISLSFSTEHKYLITGGNGSGKSTLLKLLAGYVVPSIGKAVWSANSQEISNEEVYNEISYCSPSMSLFDSHTVEEAINFHFSLKKCSEDWDIGSILEFCYLEESRTKLISQLSSGMLQRLKLTLAFLSKTATLFLDEPCANLDDKAISWYQEGLKKYENGRLLVICSNNKEEEHFMCNKTVNLEDYKKFSI